MLGMTLFSYQGANANFHCGQPFAPFVNLSTCDLRGQELFQVNLSGADLSGANFSGDILKRVDFTNATLSGAKPTMNNKNSRWVIKLNFNLGGSSLID